MRREQADDAAVALHDALRVPRHVVGHDGLCLLEVLAFGEHVGGDEQVDLAVWWLVARDARRCWGRSDPARRALVGCALVADHHDALAAADQRGEVFVEVADRRAEGREDSDLGCRAGLEDVDECGQLGIVGGVKAGELVADGGELVAVGRTASP